MKFEGDRAQERFRFTALSSERLLTVFPRVEPCADGDAARFIRRNTLKRFRRTWTVLLFTPENNLRPIWLSVVSFGGTAAAHGLTCGAVCVQSEETPSQGQ